VANSFKKDLCLPDTEKEKVSSEKGREKNRTLPGKCFQDTFSMKKENR
jgi:hypothetical protein